LGVSLVSSPSKIQKSIKTLKDNDISRTLFMLQRNEENCNNMLEGNSSFIVEEANKLCDDLLHEDEDETTDHKDLFMWSIKPKRVYKNRNLETLLQEDVVKS
jgi:ATP-dependent protease Clp ATPase subunit